MGINLWKRCADGIILVFRVSMGDLVVCIAGDRLINLELFVDLTSAAVVTLFC